MGTFGVDSVSPGWVDALNRRAFEVAEKSWTWLQPLLTRMIGLSKTMPWTVDEAQSCCRTEKRKKENIFNGGWVLCKPVEARYGLLSGELELTKPMKM